MFPGHSSLADRRILVTRPRPQAGDLCDKLTALGARPIPFPTIEIAPMADYAALDEVLRQIGQYHWIIFTSVNGVRAFWGRLAVMGLELPATFAGKFAAIGPATAAALEQRGVRADYMPRDYVAEALAAGLGEVEGRTILLPRAEAAREVLADELRRRGAKVDEIATYRTLSGSPDSQALAELRRGVDAITFTGSSTVRNFVMLATASVPAMLVETPVVACIGPITAHTAKDAGLRVNVVAREYTVDGLIWALADYFARPELQAKQR